MSVTDLAKDAGAPKRARVGQAGETAVECGAAFVVLAEQRQNIAESLVQSPANFAFRKIALAHSIYLSNRGSIKRNCFCIGEGSAGPVSRLFEIINCSRRHVRPLEMITECR